MGGLIDLNFAPKGDALAFGFNRIQGGVAAPGLKPKHKRTCDFGAKVTRPNHKKPKRLGGRRAYRKPLALVFSRVAKSSCHPLVARSPRGRLAQEVRSPEG